MDLTQIKYFHAIARHQSIARASDELFVSQPALSKSLARLEDELGVQLFERSGKRLHLNERGEFFLESTKRILRDLEMSAQSLKHGAANRADTLRVAVFGPQNFAISCLDAYMHQNPNMRIDLEARRLGETTNLLRRFDLVFYPAGPSLSDIAGIPYARTEFCALVPEGHPLADRERVELAELSREPFVFTNTTEGEYAQHLALCAESGFYPRIRAVTTSGLAQNAFIKSGLGIGFSNTLAQARPKPGLRRIPLDAPGLHQTLCIASRPVSLLSRGARDLLSHTVGFLLADAGEDILNTFDAN